ncbi:MAG: hypothetical protein ACD_16C00036G0015 [uncultured bacterium]|nr:MAG: hypothetical protein ACD_16C00036G0015 [uncultured bacterium]OFW91261.1 MAG: hypothetical protein A2W46_02555 [Alphaproteobacteria bacterium RIFCSPHIGHO2_12_42_13]HBG34386.1 hypothetical protein [Holosporales bacterium]
MNIKFLGITIMALQLTTSAYAGINYKLLELEADTYHHRIWSGTPSDEEMIKKSLIFMSKEDTIDTKYTQAESFLKFYKESNDAIGNAYFHSFSLTCKQIFDDSDNLHKAAVYMLLESVREKSAKIIKLRKKIEESDRRYEETPREGDPNSDRILDYFLNFDKSPKVDHSPKVH